MIKEKSPEDIYKYLSQVSHDIRSPLSALNLVFSTIQNLSSEQQYLIQESILRINKISDELMEMSRNKGLAQKPNSNESDQLAPAPSWYKEGVRLKTSSLIVIVDDDPQIHNMWERQFTKHSEFKKMKIMHFESLEKFKDWHYSEHEFGEIFYFIDLEFANEIETGIGLIERLGLSSRSILVTSKYDDAWVLEKAKKLNLKVLPKSIAASLPIQFSS